MTTPRAAGPAAALLTAAALLSACGAGPPDHVRLGVIAPLSGPRAFLGQEVENGAALAVEDINRAGGLLGEPVELVTIDDADLVDLPGQLADLAERVRVSAVIGPEAPGVLLGPRNPLSRRDVPAILPTAFTGDLTGTDTVVVRTIPGATAQARTLGRWLAEVREASSIAVLIVDPVEGTAARDELAAGLADGGIDVAAMVEADADAIQLGPAVAAVRRAAPDADAILVWGPPAAAARATLAVRDLAWDVQIAVPASSFVAEYRTLAGTAAEGVVLAFPFRQEWFGAELTSWMLRYHREHGLGALPQLETLVLDVPVVAIAAYDAVRLVAEAVAAAGSRVPADVAAAIDGVHYDGILKDYDVGAEREAWSSDELFVARFHRLATVYDADPRLDAADQRRFWELQVSADYVPQEVLEGPAGALIRDLLAAGRRDPPAYAPPLPPPGPVARP